MAGVNNVRAEKLKFIRCTK